jgi:hypothetical protein
MLHLILLILLLSAFGLPSFADAPRAEDELTVVSDRYAAVAAEMQARAGDGFTVVIEPPYVVAGDGRPADVERRAHGTVRWAHNAFRDLYFAKDPAEPVPVWLFANDKSYVAHVEAWLHETPDTPYGFADESGLYMNISTGGGTLIHEMVHPLIATNFPDCPPWFNEGLASLYEHTGVRAGQIHGELNWRLPGLQAGIRNKAVPPFALLMTKDHQAFYRDPAGLHYGTSRYLLYYLQEQGLLDSYYRDLVANAATDPSGVETLKKTLGREDLWAFQQEWEAWVMTQKR